MKRNLWKWKVRELARKKDTCTNLLGQSPALKNGLQMPFSFLRLGLASQRLLRCGGMRWVAPGAVAERAPYQQIPADGFLRCPIAPQHRPMQRLYLAHSFSMFQLYAVCLCLLRGSRHRDTSFAYTEATMTSELKLKQKQYSSAKVQVEQLIKKATANHGESIAGYECPNVLELMVARCSRHVCRSVQEKTLAKHTDQLEHQESRLACEWQAAGYSMIDNIAGCTPIISNLLLWRINPVASLVAQGVATLETLPLVFGEWWEWWEWQDGRKAESTGKCFKQSYVGESSIPSMTLLISQVLSSPFSGGFLSTSSGPGSSFAKESAVHWSCCSYSAAGPGSIFARGCHSAVWPRLYGGHQAPARCIEVFWGLWSCSDCPTFAEFGNKNCVELIELPDKKLSRT